MSDYGFNVLMDTLRGAGIASVVVTGISTVMCLVGAGNACESKKPLLSIVFVLLAFMCMVTFACLWTFLYSTWGVNTNMK